MSEAIPEQPVKAMGKKVGPLPLWAYGVIIVGGAYLAYWYKNRVGVGSAAPVTVSPDLNQTGFSSAGPAPGTGTYTGQVDTAEKGAPAPQSNAQWARSTADSLIASGSDPTAVNGALSRYLNGNTLSSTDQAIVNVAISRYGNPPQGVVPMNTTPNYTGFLRDDITGAVFGILPDGLRVWLTPDQYKAAGAPEVTSSVTHQFDHYERDTQGKIYGIMAGTGQRVWLDGNQYAALGSPAYTQLTETHQSTSTPGSVSVGHKYTWLEGDTLASVAKRFYGNESAGNDILAANPGVTFSPGTVVTIP